MKKLMILLALLAALTLSLTACGGDAPETEEELPLSIQEEEPADPEEPDETEEDAEEPAEEEAAADEETQEETPPAAKPGSGSANQKPAQKPAQKPDQKPAEKPAEKPSQPETPATVGQTLKGAFQANPSGSALTVAQRVVGHESIPFAPMAMAVEPGLLNGFGNTEITGFSEGASFGPAIGTIPFLGYVFTLDGTVSGSTFCQTLKNAADLRWNICTEADELVVTQSGDKVFFLMCPEKFS